MAISGTPADGRRKTGRPKKTWHITFQQDLQIADFKCEEVEYNMGHGQSLLHYSLLVQLTVQNGAKLLPGVPKGTGGTKST